MHERARQHLDEFFRHLGDERRLSPLTLTHYRRDLSQCMTYCDSAGIADWERLTVAEVRGWVSALHRRGLSGKSIQRALSALRTFYRYLLREQVVTCNPASGVSAPKSTRRLARHADRRPGRAAGVAGGARSARRARPRVAGTAVFLRAAPVRTGEPQYSRA